MANGQKLPTSYTFTDKPDQTIEIDLVHKKIKVNGDNPLKDGAKTSTGVIINGAHKDDLSKVYKRQIGVYTPDKKLNKITQDATLTRSATYDDVNGKVTYNNDWSTGKFDKYSAQDIAGYKTGKPAPEETVNYTPGEQEAKFFIIRYTPLDQSGYISYVDNSDGHEVGTTPLSGKTDQSVTVTPTAPAGWEIVPGQDIPKNVTATAKGIPTVKVKVQHQTTTVTPDTPKDQIPTGPVPGDPGKSYETVDQKTELTKTITRTINVTKPDGTKLTPVVQTVTYTRNAILDHVTGKKSYTDWTTTKGSWDKYTAPEVAGYKTPSAAGQEVPVTTTDTTVNLTYTANGQTGKISYVDNGDGHEVDTTPLSGKTDQSVTVTPTAPAGWEIVPGQDIPKNVIATAKGIPTVKVKVQHQTTTVTPDTPKDQIPTGALPGDPKKNYPAVDQTSELIKKITRTINVTDPQGKKTTTKQTVTFKRNVTIDEVTGDETYSDWTTDKNSWDAFTAKEIPGYTANKTVAQQIVQATDSDTSVDITYTANDQATHIIYKDTDGKDVKKDTVNGKTDQTVDTNSTVPAGWKISDQSKVKTVPSTITFTGASTPDTVIIVEHAHKPVKPDQPVKPGDNKTPDGKTTIDCGHKADLNQTITRTVNITDPHSRKTTTTIQTAHITRNGDLDEVTGHVTYGDWTTDDNSWLAVNVPTVPGYTPSQSSVDKVTVKDGDKDQTIDITYTPNDGTQTINYVDKDGKKVGDSQVIPGKTDQNIKVTPQVPAGWVLTKDSGMPTDVTIKPSDTPIKVKIEHGTHVVTPDNPAKLGDKTPSGNVINGGHETDLTKTITRTINVTDPSGKTTTTTQTAQLTRTGTVDDVTGEVTYTPWTTDNTSWTEVDVPSVPGYTPSQKHVDAETVDINTQSQTININYTLDPTNTASNDHVSDQTTNGQNATNGPAATTATPSNDGARTQSNNQKKQLPQTGNKHSSMAALGLGLMSFLGLYGFHKKEDED